MKKIITASLLLVFSIALVSADTLTQDQARDVALADAGISLEEVETIEVKSETNGINRTFYSIEFYTAKERYFYKVQGNSGEIMTRSSRIMTGPSNKMISTENLLETSEVQKIALDAAGLTSSQASVEKIKLNTKDSDPVYEVKIRSGKDKYEFLIHGETGRIIFQEKD